MNLFNYYKKAVIYPSVFILFFGIVYSFMENFKSDPLPIQSVIQMSILPAFIFTLLICALSLTIFLNKFKRLSKNIIWNLLTWFFLPTGYILIILLHDFQNRIKFAFCIGTDFFYLMIMTIPYVIGLIWTFMKYRQEILNVNIV